MRSLSGLRLASFLFAILTATGCTSVPGEEDLELSVGPTAGPGLGGLIGFSQRAWSDEHRRVDLEVDYVVQRLDEEPTGEDFDQIRFGLRLRTSHPEESSWSARLGATFLRGEGDLGSLKGTGDFGGIYASLGYEFALSRNLRMGPDLSLLAVTSEGTGDSGFLPQLAWRVYYLF